MAEGKYREDPEQRLYVEGQISGMRTICAIIIDELDPRGDLKARVQARTRNVTFVYNSPPLRAV